MYSPRIILAARFCGTGGKPSLRTKGLPTSPLVPPSVPLSPEEGADDRLSSSDDRLSATSSSGRSRLADTSPSPGAPMEAFRPDQHLKGGGATSRPSYIVVRTRPRPTVCHNQDGRPPRTAAPTRGHPWAPRPSKLVNLQATHTQGKITFLCRLVRVPMATS